MAFPTTLSSFVTGPTSATLVTAGHAANHNAIEAKLGIDGSAVTTSIDYLLKNTASIDPGHHHTTSSVDSLAASKLTGTVAVLNGGTGASTAATARSALGLAIGVDIQAFGTNLGTWGLKTPPSGVTLGTTDTQTLTNKRITKRTGTTASSATPSINVDNVDFYSITALAVAITSMTTSLSGTATEGQTLWIAITDNGTARAIAWGTSFEASGNVALPTTTVISTRLDVGFVWNSVTSKWRCVAVS